MTVPHPIPYQGSKRRMASEILRFVPPGYARLFEPFAGSAALSLAAADTNVAASFVLGDSLEPLARLWAQIVKEPRRVADRYRQVWEQQGADPRAHFLDVRGRFNQTKEPALLLYLVARCVKNAVRFNPQGDFNQSADHRRKGMHPDKMERQLLSASALFEGRCQVVAGDYRELLRQATARDLVYMDPPYQGVSGGRDKRYAEQLDLEAFVLALEALTKRSVDFLVSFDGSCGEKSYGEPLPPELGLTRVRVQAGKSSQATLCGRDETTEESLYVSPSLLEKLGDVPPLVVVKQGLPVPSSRGRVVRAAVRL